MSLADYDSATPAAMPRQKPVELDNIDYANPNHVPYMVASALIDCSGAGVETSKTRTTTIFVWSPSTPCRPGVKPSCEP